MKVYKPLYLLLDPELIYELDNYKIEGVTRTQLVSDAIEEHISRLKEMNARTHRWKI